MTPYYVGVVWTGFDQPEHMYVSGNPAAQVWNRIMRQVHDGLEWRNFTEPTSIGEDTQIFGDLTSPHAFAHADGDAGAPAPVRATAAALHHGTR